MAKNEWWVKISVSLMDHFVWNGEPFTRGQAWVDLIMLVNHEPTKTVVDGQVIEVGIGEYVTSIRRLADRWNRSVKWVMDYLDLLRSDNMVETKVVGHGKNSKTLLFLVNYEGFQLSGNAKETHRKRIENAKKTQDGGKGVLDKVLYNISIETEELKNTPCILTDTVPHGDDATPIRKRIPPSVEMVRAYCEERDNNIDPQAFVDHYESNGWMVGRTKMKDWQASVRTWEKNHKHDPPRKTEPTFDVEKHLREMQEEGLL